MAIDKVFYNEGSAAKLGWDPSWFGEDSFDDDLIVAIKKWQKSHGLTADGLCGPATFRRLWTEREENISDYAPPVISCGHEPKHIVHPIHLMN